MHPTLTQLLAQCREKELRRAARMHVRPDLPSREPSPPGAITLRFAFPDDSAALARLAELDSTEPPRQPVLVGEVSGELRAALSLADGRAIADPFHPAAGLIELLRKRARQLEADRPNQGFGRLRFGRLAFRLARTA
jgi:hypothetical protein